MRQIRTSQQAIDRIRAGDKTLDVQLAVPAFANVHAGEIIELHSTNDVLQAVVAAVRRYDTFNGMVAEEDMQSLVGSDTKADINTLFHSLYSGHRETHSLLVMELSGSQAKV